MGSDATIDFLHDMWSRTAQNPGSPMPGRDPLPTVGTTKTSGDNIYSWDGSKWVFWKKVPTGAGSTPISGGSNTSGSTTSDGDVSITPVHINPDQPVFISTENPNGGSTGSNAISRPSLTVGDVMGGGMGTGSGVDANGVPYSTNNLPPSGTGTASTGGGSSGAGGAAAGGSGSTGVQFPTLPDVGAPFDVPLPTTDMSALGNAFGGVAGAVGALDSPDVRAIYGRVDPMNNMGHIFAGRYNDIGYQQNDESINKLYDDMMKLYNWDETKQSVLQEGAIGNRMMAAANAASGRGLGGSFISGQSQADINTQSNLLAKKQEFLSNLVNIQQNRAQALATEHQLAQKYGIDIGMRRAEVQTEEDKYIRESQYNLALTQAAAELGVESTKYTALVNAVAAGETAKAQAIANELSKQTDRSADLLIAKATAQSNIMGREWEYKADIAKTAATTEPSLTDISTSTGLGVQVDPKTGIGTITGSDKTLQPTAVNTIQKIDGRISYNGTVLDIRSDLTNWCADNPNASEAQIKAQAAEMLRKKLYDLAIGMNKSSADAETWAADRMKEIFGPTWSTDFSGVVTNAKFKPSSTTATSAPAA